MSDEKKEESIKEEPKTNEVKINHGNVETIMLQMLNRIVENTNRMVEILDEMNKK